MTHTPGSEAETQRPGGSSKQLGNGKQQGFERRRSSQGLLRTQLSESPSKHEEEGDEYEHGGDVAPRHHECRLALGNGLPEQLHQVVCGARCCLCVPRPGPKGATVVTVRQDRGGGKWCTSGRVASPHGIYMHAEGWCCNYSPLSHPHVCMCVCERPLLAVRRGSNVAQRQLGHLEGIHVLVGDPATV